MIDRWALIDAIFILNIYCTGLPPFCHVTHLLLSYTTMKSRPLPICATTNTIDEMYVVKNSFHDSFFRNLIIQTFLSCFLSYENVPETFLLCFLSD
jgi:hypothetical protein